MRRLFRLILWAAALAAVIGAIAVAFIDLPAPSRAIEQPISIERDGAQ